MKKGDKPMRCAVVGLGEFGRAMAVGLAQYGAEVLAIDCDKRKVEAVKDDVALAVCLDATEEDGLKEHGVGQVDALVAGIGGNFEAQVLTVVHARKLGAKHIVARATTADHMRVLRAVGADEVFNPEEEAARRVVERLVLGRIENFFEVADGFSVVEIRATPDMAGKTLAELNLRKRYRINVIGVKRAVPGEEGEPAPTQFNPVPLPDERIREGDVLAIVGSVLDIAIFMKDREQAS
ncbi:MAG: TrkA family potassium uptake protein [Verrucomicrobia bacterium]|nr:TrkA family potassium uptake protein [Verrucomicrobiota bacterium]